MVPAVIHGLVAPALCSPKVAGEEAVLHHRLRGRVERLPVASAPSNIQVATVVCITAAAAIPAEVVVEVELARTATEALEASDIRVPAARGEVPEEDMLALAVQVRHRDRELQGITTAAPAVPAVVMQGATAVRAAKA